MDTSETYIKMCLKAREVQALATQTQYDYWVHAPVGAGMIWLPRQDQLQEMLYPGQEARTIFAEFAFLVGDSRVEFLDLLPEYRQYTSMEQLWLAFVMKQKHNKIWNGQEWIREV